VRLLTYRKVKVLEASSSGKLPTTNSSHNCSRRSLRNLGNLGNLGSLGSLCSLGSPRLVVQRDRRFPC
jgi:hypothetical protein